MMRFAMYQSSGATAFRSMQSEFFFVTPQYRDFILHCLWQDAVISGIRVMVSNDGVLGLIFLNLLETRVNSID